MDYRIEIDDRGFAEALNRTSGTLDTMQYRKFQCSVKFRYLTSGTPDTM